MTDTETNAIPGTPSQPFNLGELSEVLMRRDRVPFGFFVSQELWDAITARFCKEASDPLATIPNTFNGLQIVVDPDLPATEFEVAFTEEAWTKKLRQLRR